ncbi:MAG: flagellar hook-length control protein FliK [Burkholderiales bacterium]|nr:flagellar hook-length control protein FliK [Burkholderiales bacterium]
MDTPALIPPPPTHPPGNTVTADSTRTEATAAGFAALLALELAPTADIAGDPALPAEDATDTETGDNAAMPLFAADPLASLQLPAVPPPPATHNRGNTRSTADFPAETASRIDATPAKSAAGGNSPLPAAVAGDHMPDAALTGRSVAMQEPPAQAVGVWQAAPLSPQTPAAAVAALPRMEVPVSQPGWSEAFAQRVLLLTGKQQQSAELHLNPPELGPVSIVLSMDNDLANVFFSSPLVPVREAIENAMPTLREALGQAGIQLGETGVSAENFRREAEARGQAGTAAAAGKAEESGPRHEGAQRILARHPGLVDTFA